MKKTDVLDLLREMPDEIDADDLIYKLYLKQKLHSAEKAAADGDTATHDDVVKLSDEWLK